LAGAEDRHIANPRHARQAARRSANLRKGTRLTCHDRLGEAAALGHGVVGLGDSDHFFDGGLALRHPTPAVLPQGEHAFPDGALFQLSDPATTMVN
jgi:hypothetical protein